MPSMYKPLFAFVVVCLLLCNTSCKNCTDCVRYPNKNDKIKLCKKDFASDDAYEAYYRQLVYDGYRCE